MLSRRSRIRSVIVDSRSTRLAYLGTPLTYSSDVWFCHYEGSLQPHLAFWFYSIFEFSGLQPKTPLSLCVVMPRCGECGGNEFHELASHPAYWKFMIRAKESKLWTFPPTYLLLIFILRASPPPFLGFVFAIETLPYFPFHLNFFLRSTLEKRQKEKFFSLKF